ncbi:MAG: pyridoxal-phosphate dependent enzyme [Myxococcota bacterium]
MLFHLAPAAADGRFPEIRAIEPAPGEAFVHLCRQDQLRRVARQHFPGRVLQAVTIDPRALSPDRLRDEDLYGHGAFPHYYGPIGAEAIRGRVALPPVDRADVEAAEPVVRSFFPPTPLLLAPRLSRRLGREIWLKLETMTPIRTFKIRGALTRIAAIQHPGPVITASGGNHGLAVAWAARAMGRPATVVIPERANPRKAEAIAALGAHLVQVGTDYQAAYEHSLGLGAQLGAEHIHAYDDPYVIAGQGTVGLEIAGLNPGAIFAGIGGGGLIGGLAAFWAGHEHGPSIFGGVVRGGDSMLRSREQGRIVSLDRVTTVADGLGARRPGALSFALVESGVEDLLEVTDADLFRAAQLLFWEERIVVEIAGAAGLAAALLHPDRLSERSVIVLSGANASDETLEQIARPLPRE